MQLISVTVSLVIADGNGHKAWQSADQTLNFKSNDDNLDFNDRNLDANDNYSGGLLFVGSVS